MTTQVFNKIIYRSPPLGEYPNIRFPGNGQQPGKKTRKRPTRTSTPLCTPGPLTTQPANPSSAPATLQDTLARSNSNISGLAPPSPPCS